MKRVVTMMATTARRRAAFPVAWLFKTVLCLISLRANAFLIAPQQILQSHTLSPLQHTVRLFAKKKRRAPKETKNTGFGGAAVVPCPCGSGLGYMKCCGKIHKDPKAYAAASAEQVVRARYSAYAKRDVGICDDDDTVDLIRNYTHLYSNDSNSLCRH
jgi:hypothetical protein